MGTTTAALTQALHHIDKLEAARRRVSRSLDRYRAGSDLFEETARERDALDGRLAHWRGVVARAEADGLKVWSRQDFMRGDFVQYRGVWYEVLRVNPRSVTVPHALNGIGGDGAVRRGGEHPDLTWTIGYHDGISGRKTAGEMDPHGREGGARGAHEPESAP